MGEEDGSWESESCIITGMKQITPCSNTVLEPDKAPKEKPEIEA